MKKNLLVTLADKNYLDQAKQLFSSAYFNAGWQGDYMLLVPSRDKNDPGLQWFRDKGILIKAFGPLHEDVIGSVSRNETIIKFYLFTSEFKKWGHIIYSDVDIIIRASLDGLSKVKGFAGVPDVSGLTRQFLEPPFDDQAVQVLSQYQKLSNNYSLQSKAFNTGFFVFNTEIIKDDLFDRINNFFNDYYMLGLHGDQPFLNLYFYKTWEELPPVYNVYILGDYTYWGIKLAKIKGIILHSPGSEKLWQASNYFCQEWKNNLAKADQINLKNIPVGNKWSKKKIARYSWYLKNKTRILYFYQTLYFFIDRKIGQFGLLLKKYSLSTYKALKNLKRNK